MASVVCSGALTALFIAFAWSRCRDNRVKGEMGFGVGKSPVLAEGKTKLCVCLSHISLSKLKTY